MSYEWAMFFKMADGPCQRGHLHHDKSNVTWHVYYFGEQCHLRESSAVEPALGWPVGHPSYKNNFKNNFHVFKKNFGFEKKQTLIEAIWLPGE